MKTEKVKCSKCGKGEITIQIEEMIKRTKYTYTPCYACGYPEEEEEIYRVLLDDFNVIAIPIPE